MGLKDSDVPFPSFRPLKRVSNLVEDFNCAIILTFKEPSHLNEKLVRDWIKNQIGKDVAALFPEKEEFIIDESDNKSKKLVYIHRNSDKKYKTMLSLLDEFIP